MSHLGLSHLQLFILCIWISSHSLYQQLSSVELGVGGGSEGGQREASLLRAENCISLWV